MDLITFQCPNCRQVLKVGADKAGRQAKCPRCATAVQVPSLSGAGPAQPRPAADQSRSTKRPPARPARDEDNGYEEVDDRYEDRPRKRAPRDVDDDADGRPRRRADRDAEEDEDDRPRRRRGGREEEDYEDDGRPRRRRSEDEEYEDDDRPRRRRREPDEEEEVLVARPRKKGGMSNRNKWGFVSIGLFIVFFSTFAVAGAMALELIFDLLVTIMMFSATVGSAPSGGLAKTAEIMMKIAQVLMFAGVVGTVVGYVFGVFAPTKKGALGLAIATLALGVVHVVMRLIFILIPIFGSPLAMDLGVNAAGGLILAMLITISTSADYILASLFLNSVASNFKARGLSGRCLVCVFLASAAVALAALQWVIFFIFSKNPSKGMLWFGLIFHWIADLVFVSFLAAYIPCLLNTKYEIDSK